MVTMSTPYKDPNSGVYKLRKAIPEELRSFFINKKTGKPQREYWQTLATKELKEAKRLFPDVLADFERKLEAARAQLEGRSYSLSDLEAKALAGEWLKRELDTTSNIPDDIEIVLSVYPDMIEQRKFETWAFRADEVIEANRLSILPSSESYQKLCEELAYADLKFWSLMDSRARGDWQDKGLVQYPSFNPSESNLKLMELYERFEKEDKPEVRRRADFTRNIDRFIEMHGDIPVGSVKPEQVVAWKDTLVDQGLASSTINDRLRVIDILLEYAKVNHLITMNAACGIKVKGKKVVDRRLTLSLEDINAIFSGPVHAEGKRPLGGKGEASFWLPLISLYSGARLAEIAQLTRSDIDETDGVPFFSINRNGDKKAKNDNSIRKVPLHQRLIQEGFLGFAEGMEDTLFPGLEASASGQVAKAWGQWYSRYKKDRGVTGKKDFHSFRHTFIDACREAGIDSELRMKITGHAPQDVGSGYGTADLLKRLKAEIDKVDYWG